MGERSRLVAWNRELAAAHTKLRGALRLAQEAVGDPEPREALRDLLLYCHGFCVALDAHHQGEDRSLFPELAAQYPQLRETIAKLEQDHSMIAYLLGSLDDAVKRSASAEELTRHLEGLSAIMESHFRYEERSLEDVLTELDLDADPDVVFGPL